MHVCKHVCLCACAYECTYLWDPGALHYPGTGVTGCQELFLQCWGMNVYTLWGQYILNQLWLHFWSLRHMVAQYLPRRGWNSRSTASLHCISESSSLSFFTPFPVRLTSDISHLILDTTTRGVWGTSSSGHSPPCHSQGVHQILLSSKMLLHTYAHFIFTCYIFILRVCSLGDFIFFFSVSFFSFFFLPLAVYFNNF